MSGCIGIACVHFRDPEVFEGSRNVLGECAVKREAVGHDAPKYWATCVYDHGSQCEFEERRMGANEEHIAGHLREIETQNARLDKKWGKGASPRKARSCGGAR